MEQARRDLFKKIGVLGASALALAGASKRAKAFEGNEQQNPLLGLWDLTIPVQPAVGAPVPLYFKYAISEGAYVVTGNSNPTVNSPATGTYARTGPNSYRIRERGWVYDTSGNPAGTTDFKGTAIVAGDGKTWSGSGTLTGYDVNGKVVFTAADFTYTAVKFSA
jgi:hypothetical protein